MVYSIPCAQCPRTYIGQTGRFLDVRLREHRRALKNGDLAASALAEYVFSCDYQVDLSKATVIDAHTHTQTRCMLESWHNTNRAHSTETGALCQDSTLHCWTDADTLWGRSATIISAIVLNFSLLFSVVIFLPLPLFPHSLSIC